jgi:hypothetical protein
MDGMTAVSVPAVRKSYGTRTVSAGLFTLPAGTMHTAPAGGLASWITCDTGDAEGDGDGRGDGAECATVTVGGGGNIVFHGTIKSPSAASARAASMTVVHRCPASDTHWIANRNPCFGMSLSPSEPLG